jgi:hypothetical protein
VSTVTPYKAPTPWPTAGAPAAPAPSRPRRPVLEVLRALPTPRKLVVALIATLAGVALLLAVTASSASSASGAMQTIGHTAAPQIAADEDISFSLADMDTQAANWLLVGRRALGSTEADAGAAYYRDRDLATRDLIAASHSGGDAAQGSIGSVLTGLTTYHGYALQAELLADQGDALGALDEYRLATGLMHGTLLPAMASVTAINVKALDDAYSAQQSASARGIALVVLVGLLLLGVLLATQWFLLQRMRRIVNPGLLGATLVALVLTVAALSTFGGVRSDLEGTKQDAFDARLALVSARATAYDANSDRSRALIDAFYAGQYQSAFAARSTQIAGSAFGAAVLPGAQDAVQAARTAFQTYQADDRTLLGLVAAGKGDAAIAYATSVSHGSSGYDFQRFDAALQTGVNIDQGYLTAYVAESDSRLSPWTWLPPVAAVLIAALAVAGVWPRLREYQGG